LRALVAPTRGSPGCQFFKFFKFFIFLGYFHPELEEINSWKMPSAKLLPFHLKSVGSCLRSSFLPIQQLTILISSLHHHRNLSISPLLFSTKSLCLIFTSRIYSPSLLSISQTYAMEAPADEVGRGPPLDVAGNNISLEKQNKLFDLNLNINTQIALLSQAPTSKVAFLGHLTGIPNGFFEATTTLTVQIVFRRAPLKLITISIVPWKETDAAVKGSFKATIHHAVHGDPGDDLVQKARNVRTNP
jgi:hypothetical protein